MSGFQDKQLPSEEKQFQTIAEALEIDKEKCITEEELRVINDSIKKEMTGLGTLADYVNLDSVGRSAFQSELQNRFLTRRSVAFHLIKDELQKIIAHERIHYDNRIVLIGDLLRDVEMFQRFYAYLTRELCERRQRLYHNSQ